MSKKGRFRGEKKADTVHMGKANSGGILPESPQSHKAQESSSVPWTSDSYAACSPSRGYSCFQSITILTFGPDFWLY